MDITITRSSSDEEILAQAQALAEGPNTRLSLMSNLASLVYWSLPDVNWCGVYLMEGGRLMLGPFHGQPACVQIAMGKGVCGTAAASRETVVVDDVHTFPGHIACDAASRSEIVIPLVQNGELLGVLDVDSPVPARFGARERTLLESVAAIITGFTA